MFLMIIVLYFLNHYNNYYNDLEIKIKPFSEIIDEYSQISITLPEDGKKILFAQSDTCLMVKQSNFGDYEDFRCFGSLGYCKLERMDKNTNISGWFYYI